MHKVIVFLLLSLSLEEPCRAQVPALPVTLQEKSLRSADSASRSDGRPLFIYLYLKPCPACRSYEAGTLSDAQIRKVLSEDFHFAAIDVRTRTTLEWKGRRYGWDPASGLNGVVAGISKGSRSFPVSAIFSPEGDWHQSIAGDIGKEELACLLNYASEAAWKKISYDEFRGRRMKVVPGTRQ
jgi:thioredoxin-related protein